MSTVALCLDQLLDHRKTAPFILLNDTVQFGSLSLLTEFARRTLRDSDHTVIAILTETNERVWKSRLPREHTVLSLVDSHLSTFDKVDFQSDVLNHVQRYLPDPRTSRKCTIMIDSLGPLALISERQTYQLVKELANKTTENIRLIVGHHADVRLPAQAQRGMNVPLSDSLNRLASAVVALEALDEPSVGSQALTGFVTQDTFSYLQTMSNRITRGGLARIEWRRKSGKVQYETNGFYLDTVANALVVVPSTQLVGSSTQTHDETIDDEPKSQPPKVDATFNLSLTEEQRKAKESLVLPYMKAQQYQPSSAGEVEVDSGASSGAIFYEPDAGDDFDDEDPDEDLDI